MLPDDPRHGTQAGAHVHWKTGEKPCDPCMVAVRRAKKAREVNTLAGRPARVPLGEDAYRIVVESPRNQLAKATGIRSPRLRDFELGGPEKIVHRDTRARILAAGRPWTAVGIQRRLQALSCAGWSAYVIAEEIGVFSSTLSNIRRRDRLVFIRSHLATAILDFYATHGHDAPVGRSATETRDHACRQGWAPAHAWLDIDDPDETPDPGWTPRSRVTNADEYDDVVVARILTGEWRLVATIVEKVEVLSRWTTAGRSDNELERLTGWNIARDLRPRLPREERAA